MMISIALCPDSLAKYECQTSEEKKNPTVIARDLRYLAVNGRSRTQKIHKDTVNRTRLPRSLTE